MKILGFIILTMSCWSVHAVDNNQRWNWYYVALGSRVPKTSLVTRIGVSDVTIAGGSVSISFIDHAIPELKATYIGAIDSDKKVTGELDGFFLEGSLHWSGTYSDVELPAGCHWQEIILRSGIGDGALLMLSRMSGDCHVVNDQED